MGATAVFSTYPCDDAVWQLVMLWQAVATNANSFWISFRRYPSLIIRDMVLQTACHPSHRLTPSMNKNVRASFSRPCAALLSNAGKHDLRADLAIIADGLTAGFNAAIASRL